MVSRRNLMKLFAAIPAALGAARFAQADEPKDVLHYPGIGIPDWVPNPHYEAVTVEYEAGEDPDVQLPSGSLVDERRWMYTPTGAICQQIRYRAYTLPAQTPELRTFKLSEVRMGMVVV